MFGLLPLSLWNSSWTFALPITFPAVLLISFAMGGLILPLRSSSKTRRSSSRSSVMLLVAIFQIPFDLDVDFVNFIRRFRKILGRHAPEGSNISARYIRY